MSGRMQFFLWQLIFTLLIVGLLSPPSRERELPVGESNHCRKATNVGYLCVILPLASSLAHCALAPSALAFALRTRKTAHLCTPTPWYNHRQIVPSLSERNPSLLLSESKSRRSQLFSNGRKSTCEARSLIVSIINSVSSFSSSWLPGLAAAVVAFFFTFLAAEEIITYLKR